MPGRKNGRLMLASAFHFMLTGDTSYATPVAQELLNQLTVPGTNFANRSKWCPYDGTVNRVSAIDASEVWPWQQRLLFAYEYLVIGGYTDFTAQNHTDFKNWFTAGAQVWDEVLVGRLVREYPGFWSTPQDTTCVTGCPFENTGKFTHYGGNPIYGMHILWNSQLSFSATASALVGIKYNNAVLKEHAKRAIEGYVRFGAFPDGSLADKYRWTDCNPPCIGSAWGHEAGMLDSLVTIADHFARVGDTGLYTYTTPPGTIGGSNGGTILNILDHSAKLANLTTVHYGAYNTSQLTDAYL